MHYLLLFIVICFSHVQADAISDIKQRGHLNCGVTTGLPGFSYMDQSGEWRGFEVDYCRGIAAALFNDINKVKFVPLTNQMQFIALNMKQVDVLARVISVNYTRANQLNGLFPVIHYFDDETIMTYRFKGKKLSELDGKTICLVSGSTAEKNLYHYAQNHRWSYKPLVMSRGQLAVRALTSGRCQALAGDRSSLYVFKQELPNDGDVKIFDESIAIEPLSLMVRDADLDLYRLIQWLHYTLVKAEEIAITKKTLQEKNMTPELFNEKMNIRALDLDFMNNHWMYQVISAIGNYGEIFSLNLQNELNIPRNKNKLVGEGGMMYAPSLN